RAWGRTRGGSWRGLLHGIAGSTLNHRLNILRKLPIICDRHIDQVVAFAASRNQDAVMAGSYVCIAGYLLLHVLHKGWLLASGLILLYWIRVRDCRANDVQLLLRLVDIFAVGI